MGNVKKAISVQRNLHDNLVYIINLIIFAMQSGTAMPLSDLSAGGTTGMSEQNKATFKIEVQCFSIEKHPSRCGADVLGA